MLLLCLFCRCLYDSTLSDNTNHAARLSLCVMEGHAIRIHCILYTIIIVIDEQCSMLEANSAACWKRAHNLTSEGINIIL